MFFRRKKAKKNTLPLNSTLYLKFILVYIILGFLSLFTAATLASGLTYSGLKSSEADRLYAQATAMANDYLPGYFSAAITLSVLVLSILCGILAGAHPAWKAAHTDVLQTLRDL